MRSTQGFSLIEVVLALGIFAFAVVLIFGLVPVGLNLNRESQEESFAINAMSAIIVDRMSSPREQDSAIYRLPPLSPGMATSTNTLFLDEEYAVTPQSSAAYKVTVVIDPPEPNSLGPYLMRCQVSWPAFAASHRGCVDTVAAISQKDVSP